MKFQKTFLATLALMAIGLAYHSSEVAASGADDLSYDMVQEAMFTFNLFDKKRYGYVKVKDLPLMFKALGFQVSKNQAEILCTEFDIDPKKGVEFVEFLDLVAEVSYDDDTEGVREALRFCCDEMNTGKVDIEDLRHLLTASGDDPLDHDEFDSFIKGVRISSDNKANIDDIVTKFKYSNKN